MEYRTSNIISEENKEIINNMLMFLYSYIQLSPVYLLLSLLLFRNYLINVLRKFIQIQRLDMKYMINI